VAGNIGPAVLDASLRRSAQPAAWVLELSSYQLETTWSLDPDAAAMLNLTEDHLDRYAGLAEYGAAKARIFIGSGIQVLNRGDRCSLAMAQSGRAQITFGLDTPATGEDFGVAAGVMAQGGTPLLRVDELPIRGWHNVANALAACALARTLGVSHQALAEGLRSAPVTSLRELGHVPRLPSSRRGIRRHGEEAAGVSRTYVFARSAPSAEYDRSLAWAALLLAATGLVMVYSSSIATAEAIGYTGNNAAWFLARHGLLFGVAL